MDRIERLAAQLRQRPLMPPMPNDATTHWPECTSGIAFPSCHCAFRHCPWTSQRMPCSQRSPHTSVWTSKEGHWRLVEPCLRTPTGSVACCGDKACLRQHLATDHSDVFDETCGQETREMHYSMYLEAIAHQEQQNIPMVGASIDRRTFGHVATDLREEAVRSMVCMCCARVSLSTNGTTGIALRLHQSNQLGDELVLSNV